MALSAAASAAIFAASNVAFLPPASTASINGFLAMPAGPATQDNGSRRTSPVNPIPRLIYLPFPPNALGSTMLPTKPP